MKSLLLFFSILFLSINLFSQNLEIDKSWYFATDFTRKSDIIGKQDSLIYTCQYGNIKRSKRKPNALINILDEKLNFVSTIEVLPLKRKDIVLKVYFFKGEYHVFFERFNSAEYISTLFVSKLDDDGKISSDIKKIEAVYIKHSYKIAGKRFTVSLSNDSTKYIVECYHKYKGKPTSLISDTDFNISFVQMNRRLEILKTITTDSLSYFDPYAIFPSPYILSSKGKLLYLKYDSLFIQGSEEDSISKMELPKFDLVTFIDQKILYDEQNDMLHIFGLIAENSIKNLQKAVKIHKSTTGYYWTKFDCKKNEFVSTKIKDFDVEALYSFKDSEDALGGDKILIINNINHICLDNNGNLTISICQLENVSYNFENNTQTQSVQRTDYKGVLILSLNETGDVSWHKNIHLLQRSFDKEEFREFLTWLPDKLLYTYTDYLNYQHKVVAITIDNEGKTLSRVEEGGVNVQNVFVNQQNYHNDGRLIISAFDKTGLFKADTYFLEVKY
jgi:hypothetical protein